MQECQHFPIALDESPNPAPTLVVCAICQDIIEAVSYEKPIKVRFVFKLEEEGSRFSVL